MYQVYLSLLCFFFFSSRRRHTRYIGDWSSDVCSSDLAGRVRVLLDGKATRAYVCTRCLKGNKVQKAEIGRASCRERVETPVVAGAIRKNTNCYITADGSRS